MPLGQALEFDDSCDGLSARWTDMGWAAVGSREWCLHPHVCLLVVCLLVLVMCDACGAGAGIS